MKLYLYQVMGNRKRLMLISICFTLKLFGVLIAMLHMLEMPVFMHTIGKILEESPTSSSTKENSAHSGRPNISFKHMQMDVKMNIGANFPTDGKNKNIIHLTIRCMHADKASSATSLIVHIIIQNMTEGIQ